MTADRIGQKNKPLPFHLQFLAGGVAGVSEILIMYPLDVVKTRFQLQGTPPLYKSISDCFGQIIKSEGPTALYRGIVPPIVMEAPKRATKFAANEQYSNILKARYGHNENLKSVIPAVTGVFAGLTEAFVVVPFELVKIRLQDKSSSGKYKNTFDCIQKIVRQEGILSFYLGLESTLMRNAVWSGIYFGLIGNVTHIIEQYNRDQGRQDAKVTTLQKFTAGVIGGTLATTFNTPFDTVKTRLQNRTLSGWTIPVMVRFASKEGFGALWKGFLPKVLRLGPGGGIMLVVYEAASSFLRQYA